jgi:glucose/arabinose dehydrogenase
MRSLQTMAFCMAVTLCFVLAPAPAQRAGAQKPAAGTDEKVVGHSFVPARLEFSEAFLEELQVPEGFEISVFAEDLENPRIMAVGHNGVVYVSQPSAGRVMALRDSDGNGRADDRRVVVDGIADVHGIAYHRNRLYLAPNTELYVAEVAQDGEVGKPRLLMEGLPDGGQHPNRTLGFGPDGLLYLSIGSSCNACPEPNPEHATMLQIRLNENGGAERRIFAEGLRNTVGFGWHPETKEFWGLDMGSDWRGPDVPPEELNLIREGLHYGWPWCYGKQEVDRIIAQDPEEKGREEFCAGTEPSTLEYQAHSSPLQMVFYDGDQFPEEYRNDIFVTMRGSWNRKPPVGYKVMRLHFDENGKPVRFEDFVTGFIVEDGSAFRGRLVGIVVASDGSLLFGDDTNGVIYRVSYNNP